MTASQNGTLLLDGDALYDGTNTAGIGVLGDDNALSAQGFGAAISDSGTTVWLGGAGAGCTSGGQAVPCAASQPGFYFRLRLSGVVSILGRQLIEVADAPQGVVQLVALPGDHTLIGVGVNEIMAFDLTTSTPGLVASRVANHTLRPRLRVTTIRAGSPLDLRVRLGGKTRSVPLARLAH
jgi:hypothetical protein